MIKGKVTENSRIVHKHSVKAFIHISYKLNKGGF